MPRKNLLKGIASGLLGAFVSRNNDVDGYWAIGKLRSLSDLNGAKDITVDLLAKTLEPGDDVLQELADRFCERLRTQVERNGLYFDSICSATIDLSFNLPNIDRRMVPQTTHGTPYHCIVSITHNSGSEFSVKKHGWCDPHDPARESQSTRGSVVIEKSLSQKLFGWLNF